jgi:hypothetical protein
MASHLQRVTKCGSFLTAGCGGAALPQKRESTRRHLLTLSRIFGGQHFRFDLTTGQRLGRVLTPAHRKGESDDK